MNKSNFTRLVSVLAILLGSVGIVRGQGSTTFSYTGSVQTYTVPAGVTYLGVDMKGGCGGYAYIGSGTNPVTLAGRVVCTLAVTGGQVLNIYVGQAGPNWTSSGTVGGYNGGGQGGAFSASGGGASDIRIGGTALTNRVVVAGGGGGGGDFSVVGGNGGGLTGGSGGSYGSGNACGGGQSGPACSTGNALGTLGQGAGSTAYSYGGGGGGQWGGNQGTYLGGGGGGSSYTDPTLCTGVVHTQGYSGANGNGQVILTQLCSNPPANTGAGALCAGGSVTLANTITTGTWSSSATGVATVNSATGVVTGTGAGTVNISYIVPGGCYAMTTLTVGAMPSVTSVSTNAPLCAGATLNLTGNSPANVTGYAWSGPAAITSSASASASVPGIGTAGSGTYTLTVNNGAGSGCVQTYTTSVSILASPASTLGTASLCEGGATLLSNSVSGGTWSSTAGTVASVSPSGLVSGIMAGTSTISYTLSSGCAATTVVTVNALPVLNVSPSSAATVCYNSSTTFTALAPGATFSWAGIGGAAGLSCSSCASPVITPTSTGANVYSVTATSGAGCTSTSGVTVSVNPLPSDISGSANVCIGTSQTLSSSTGGTWASSAPGVASIGVSTGVVTGVSAGAATMTYQLGTGCYKTFDITVLPAPAPIGGTASVCTGLTANLSHGVAGGVWSSSNATVVSVNPSGTITGGSAGNATVSYTLPSGCIVTVIATSNALPAAIGGTASVCEMGATTLTDADAGGTWNSASANVSVNSFTGEVSGMTAGTAVVSYSFSNGCYRTKTVTVNAQPAAISGNLYTCYNSISVLSNSTFGGSWSSSASGVAFVDASGIVTGLTPGTATISYTMGTGCRRTGVFTVNALPSTIDGTLSTCVGSTTMLGNSDAGGTWASSNGTVATIDGSGTVTGVSQGNTTITYTLPTGCRRTSSFTVNALPSNIGGTPSVCIGGTTMLTNTSGGGTWTSGNPAIAGISATGEVTGVAAGLVNISYELSTGCMRTQVLTVNPNPPAIGGTLAVCVGQTTVLSNSVSGGTWTSSNPSAATIDASANVNGVSAGNTIITYTAPTGCVRTASVVVNGLPSAIGGSTAVCEGQSISLSSATSGGSWSSESDGIATVSSTGMVMGVMSGNVNISYTLSTGCYRTKSVQVNMTPAALTGNMSVCVGQTTGLNSTTTGGTWSSDAAGVAPVGSTGIVTGLSAGSANINYTLSTGCATSANIAVNSLPAGITGILNVCQGSTTTLNNSTSGGTWVSSNTAVANITTGGVVSGANVGSTTISYILSTGCMKTAVVNVNPVPSPMSGNLNVCQGSTTALSNSSAGGAWSSSNPTVATINGSGVVTGVTSGSSNITYTLPTGCRTVSTAVVNSLPASISGTSSVCVNSMTMLSNSTPGGTWSSSDDLTATADMSGAITGVAAGNARITYTLPTGCYKTSNVTVNGLPAAITGLPALCQGLTTGLSNATGGGSWSSSNPAIATINGAGLVNALTPGAVVISYTLPTGCASTYTFGVDGVPASITGPGTVCVGSSMMLGTTSSGGYWGAASPNATVSYLGEVTGTTTGTATISYILPSGCYRTRLVTINPLPATISGSGTVCTGLTTTLSNSSAGGTWSTNSSPLASVDASGVLSGMASGEVLVSYTLPTGCMRTRYVTVNATPEMITGVMSMCNGGTSTLNSITTGGVWSSSNTGVASIGYVGGNVTGLSAGVSTISYVMPTGCSTSAMVTINANPGAIGGSLNVCAGGSAVVTNSTLGGMWSVSDAGIATVSSAGAVSGMTAGSTMVTYTLGTGCYTTGTLQVNAVPEMYNVTGGGSYCAGGAGVSVGLSGSDMLTTYKLYRAGVTTPVGTFSGTGAPMFFGTISSMGMYTVTATNTSGCSANMSGDATVMITPVVLPTASVMSSAGDTVCAGTSVTFSAMVNNEGATPTYAWSVNSVPMSAATGNTFTYTPADGDAISVMLTSSAACATPGTATGMKMMNVMDVLTPSVAITASPSTSICQGTIATFMASGTNGGDAPVYTWMKGTMSMGTGSTLSFAPANGDVVTCWLNSNYRCLSMNNVTSNAITMDVSPVYIPEVTISVDPGTTIVSGTMVTATATVVNAGPTPSYQWLKNGVVISGATGTTYSSANLADGDSLTCVVKGTGTCGEVSINSIHMTVLPPAGVSGPANVIGELKLMPNPNGGVFSVVGQTASKEEVKLEVLDMLGQVVYSRMVRGGTLNERIELPNNLANGMYMLNVTTNGDHQSFHFALSK